ncbi:hypothetical protein M8J76_001810 [Diaphorina citri]|nr:hypothetical protein M8J76_001810 [Diaphorina citri]
MMCSKSTLPLILIQMFFSSIHSKRLANHYLLRLYRDEIKILENGTFPKRDARKLEYYKQEIARNEQLVRFQAWIKMNEDSRLYDDIQTKCYKRFKTKKRRKKAANSIEKWEKRVRIHFLQNFLLQNGYFLQRRRHHTTQPTSTVLMLQFTSDKIIPNFMKKILPNGVFYKYYLPFHSLIKKVPERIHSLVKTCVDTFKRKTRQQQNTTHSSQDQNKTLHKYLRKIERSMRKLEEALGRGTSRPNTTRKKLSKGRKRLNEILKRKRRQKRFRRKLNRINLLFPPPTTHDPERDGDIRDIFETTNSNLSYFHQTSKEPLSYETIGQMVTSSVDKYASREALVDCTQNVRLTFKETHRRTENLALGLLELGFKPGDRIGIWGPNSVQWYIASIAAAKAGLIIVDINPAYQSSELLYCIQSVQLKGIIMDETFKTQNYLNILKEAVRDLKTDGPGTPVRSAALPYFTHVVINSDKQFDGAYRFQDIELQFANKSHLATLQDIGKTVQADEGCIIQFTSGTTGSPKAALLSHFNVVNNGLLAAKRQNLFEKIHRVCIQVPFFHIYGHVIGILGSLSSGTTLVVPSPSFNPDASLVAFEKERCTSVYGTPTMYVDVLAKASRLSEEERREKFKSLEFTQVYGMTETSPVTFLHPADNEVCRNTAHTVGKVLEHTEVKVVDSDNRMVPYGQQGELLIRGYCNMLRYWGNEEKTKEILGEDNWLRTGDQFVLTKDGFGSVVGRIKDLIIRGGENIYPSEIEDFLTTHPDILEAYVYGIRDERMGEEIGASIRLTENSSLTEDELRGYFKGKISHFKVPRHIEFVQDFPKTTSGKIRKFMLKEAMEKRLNV